MTDQQITQKSSVESKNDPLLGHDTYETVCGYAHDGWSSNVEKHLSPEEENESSTLQDGLNHMQ